MSVNERQHYKFQTFDDIASVLADALKAFPTLHAFELGLTELLVNAVEHGNLEITFEEKSTLLEIGSTAEEVEKRLPMDRYKERWASLEVLAYSDEIVLIIADQGSGFDWKKFLDRKLSEVSGLHGRGMLLSEAQFKTMTYIGNGNKVVAVVDAA